ncbi:MAG: serine acetyltransferase [Sphingopyxis sp.]|uniref:serine O-acetyltransferase n=1 Tax=Sphingopyxis sp. TaxID=1908224 RepID=UPI001A4BDCB0|nr:serine acetyltransferase [Sphingopyxis sp.]MBL9067146.1 serine acetyltransferase [Sphingopyxis sp.]
MSNGFSNLCAQIAEDYRAHGRAWTKPGFRSVMVHRFGVWRMTVKNGILRAPLSLIYRWGFRHCRNVYGIELPYTVALGRRVIFEHQGGIVVHGSSRIGDDCIIRQNCTLGIRRMSELDKAPTLEARVSLGAGAVILGAVTLGQGCSIGANAVVLSDVPAGAMAVGVPARAL